MNEKTSAEAYLELKPRARKSLDGFMERNEIPTLEDLGSTRPDLAQFLIEFDQDLWPCFLDDPPFFTVQGDQFFLTPTAHEVLRGEFQDERTKDPRVRGLIQDWLHASETD